jgi:uncharacterized paraquat-inducible protein A
MNTNTPLYYKETKKCKKCECSFSVSSLFGNPHKFCPDCRSSMFASLQAYCTKHNIKTIAQKFTINKKEKKANEII